MIRVAFAVLRTPSLWPTALRQARRTAAPGWWKRRPFLPVPSGDYLRFRMLTQYGETDRPPDRRAATSIPAAAHAARSTRPGS